MDYEITNNGSVITLAAGHILAGEPGSADGRDVHDALSELRSEVEAILERGAVRSVEVFAADADGGHTVRVFDADEMGL